MGFSTTLFCSIDFNRKTYTSLDEVQDDINECMHGIEQCWRRLTGLAIMTEPRELLDRQDDDPDILDLILCDLRDQRQLLEEYYEELTRLQLLAENWGHCHTADGKAINSPVDWPLDVAFIDIG